MQSALQTQSKEVQNKILNMSFFVKFQNQSYLHCQWVQGLDIVANFNMYSVKVLLCFIQDIETNKVGELGKVSDNLFLTARLLLTN